MGGNPWVWNEILIFYKIFAENCIKMEGIGPRGAIPNAPSDPPNEFAYTYKSQVTCHDFTIVLFASDEEVSSVETRKRRSLKIDFGLIGQFGPNWGRNCGKELIG